MIFPTPSCDRFHINGGVQRRDGTRLLILDVVEKRGKLAAVHGRAPFETTAFERQIKTIRLSSVSCGDYAKSLL